MATARTRGSAAPSAKPRSDVYTGLLILALLAQVVGAAFLFMDYKEYPENKPQLPAERQKAPAGGGGAPVARPPAGPAAPPGGMVGGAAPPPGGMMAGAAPGMAPGMP
jgi:hypothetical protein